MQPQPRAAAAGPFVSPSDAYPRISRRSQDNDTADDNKSVGSRKEDNSRVPQPSIGNVGRRRSFESNPTVQNEKASIDFTSSIGKHLMNAIVC